MEREARTGRANELGARRRTDTTAKGREWLLLTRGRAQYHYLKIETRLKTRWVQFQHLLTRHPRLRRLLCIYGTFLLLCFLTGTAYFAKAAMEADGWDIQSVSRMEESTKIYDRDGNLIYEFYEKRRTVVPVSKISKQMREAIVAIEDRNFYCHSGYEIGAMGRAAIANLISRRISRGGSTLTQQLAKNSFLTPERSFRRKAQELWLARKIEKNYSKEKILELYANRVYFGSGYYGVEAAARGYFGKSAEDLNLEEAAALAGVVKAPNIYSPHVSPSLAEKRRNAVLGAMLECGFITPDRAAAAKRHALVVRPRSNQPAEADYAIDYVQDQLRRLFGNEEVFKGGLRVYTTIDTKMQRTAEAAVENHLARIEHHRRFDRAPRARYLELQQSNSGDPARPDCLQGALVCIQIHTGEICALVGGRHYRESKFNRAVYAKRQPGSAFKPFVYAAALETGLTPSTMMESSPLKYITAGGIYRPSDAHGAPCGEMTLRAALRNSINSIAVELGQIVGVQKIIRTARDFGIEENLPPVVSLPLGVGEVTPLELVKAYSAFPNEGRVVQPSIIRHVENRNGELLYQYHLTTRFAVDPQTAFLMTTMLSDVVDHGTGSGIRAAGFRLPAGGKTGTTDDFRDAWFVGFTPDAVTGVWVGFDVPQKIMRNGYAAALAVPIWVDFMKHSFARASLNEFPMPAGVVKAVICAQSGQLATPWCGDRVYSDYFAMGSAPQFPCSKHASPDLASTKSDN